MSCRSAAVHRASTTSNQGTPGGTTSTSGLRSGRLGLGTRPDPTVGAGQLRWGCRRPPGSPIALPLGRTGFEQPCCRPRGTTVPAPGASLRWSALSASPLAALGSARHLGTTHAARGQPRPCRQRHRPLAGAGLGRPEGEPAPDFKAGRSLWPTRLSWSSNGAQGSGGRIGLVSLAGIGSPTWPCSLVGSSGPVHDRADPTKLDQQKERNTSHVTHPRPQLLHLARRLRHR